MTPIPLIGLTANAGTAGASDGPVQCPSAYIDAVAAAGGCPVLVPPAADPRREAVAAVLARLDGLLLIGGRDVPPGRYGQEPHPACQPLDPRRDAWDTCLIGDAIAHGRLPILGICLGVQQLNVALGGTLVQHVPDLGSPVEHRAPESGDRLHAVALSPGSRLASILGVGTVEVTTRHHQAVDSVGRGVAVVARAPDGLPEAIEGVGAERFLVGVQWHPERNPESPASRALFAAFVAACAAAMAARTAAAVGPIVGGG